jgi:uncharacterized protein DUF3307
MLIFLQLYAAHLIADFILQPKWIVLHKQKAGPLFAHAGIHVACGIALVNVGLDRNVLLAILGLALAHILIDYIKALLTKDGWVVFFIDQILHLGTIVGAAIWLNWASWLFVEETVVATLTSAPFYLLLAAYVGVIFGGSIVVQKVTRPFLSRIEGDLLALKPGLPRAGKYIGSMERFLVLTFVITGYNEAIGFLLAVKALARFPEIKEDQKGTFAEYFLVGTMTSVGLALVAGLIVKALYAQL